MRVCVVLYWPISHPRKAISSHRATVSSIILLRLTFLVWYTDVVRRPVSPTSVMTSNVKGQGQGRKVTSSAWQVLDRKLRTKLSRNTGIARKVKVKVTTSTNAETESASYLPNGKAYELQTRYTDGVRKPVSLLSAMTSKVKDQGRKVTSSA